MDDVFIGPAINIQKYSEIPANDWPFAHRLQVALEKLGVAIQMFEPLEAGQQITPAGFIQLVAVKNAPDTLAELIYEKCGRNIQFGELILPNGGVYSTGFTRVRNVWVRHIIDYQFMHDEFLQRWDVLVRPK